MIYCSADVSAGYSPKYSFIGMMYCICLGIILVKIYQKIRFYQNLIIHSVYVAIGMVMPNQIGDSLNLFW